MFLGDAPMNANFFGQSSFATHAIAHQRNVVRVPDSAAAIPLERLAPIGCGLMTGAGAVLRAMEVRAGPADRGVRHRHGRHGGGHGGEDRRAPTRSSRWT